MIKEIKLFSVKGFTGTSLKYQLEAMLAAHQLPFKITEVNEPEDFVKAGVISTPAIKAMDKIIYHKESSPLDETINQVLDVLQSGLKRHILVPVDFSQESVHALRYALMMAGRLNKAITLVHIHEPLIDQISDSAFDMEMMKNNRRRLDEMMVEVGWGKLHSGNHIPVDLKFETGDAVSHIVPMLDDEKYEMIIMSTKAENTFWRRLLSSVSHEVSKRSHKPAIIVPPQADIKFPRKILVGLVKDLLYEDVLDYLLDFAFDNKVFLEFVHFEEDEEHFEWLKKQFTERLSSYKKKLDDFAIVTSRHEEGPVDELLLHESGQNEYDMIAVMTHHRNLINSIGHRSISKRVLLQPHLPVMILHGEDEKGLGITDNLYGMIQKH